MKRRWLSLLGYAGLALVGVIVVAAASVYGFSESRYRRQYSVTPSHLAISTDSATVARGEHLASTVGGCIDCHGANLGGSKVVDDPALGRVYGLNLTRGKGGVGLLTDADYVRAIRHGLAPDGHALKIMPSSDFAALSDADLAAIIAYVKTRPPVDHEVPSASIGPVGRALFVAGKLPILHAERIDHSASHPASVTPEPTAAYGSYLASIGCRGCHGPALAGGPIVGGAPDWPPAANLTPGGPTKSWTEADFRTLLRTGKRPDGTPVNDIMPWRLVRNLTDDEVHALWLYLRSLPAAPTGGATQTASR